jgi:serine/threonine protein kinase
MAAAISKAMAEEAAVTERTERVALTMLTRGTVLHSRYRLQHLLGRGGMASVWRARDDALERTVAVKVIADTLAADPAWVRRFQREARAMAALNHPNIVRVFDYGVDGGRPFLVMEHLGSSVLDGAADGARGHAERVARELLSALAHMHAAGLVHRDIKPANVLLAHDGSARLTDFGIAHGRDATRLTSTGMVVGSVRYLAPEVLAGEPATARSDLFSLGRLLEELTAPAPASPRLARLVRALTQPDPARRPRSAAAALATLERPPLAARALAPRAPSAIAAATRSMRERSTYVMPAARRTTLDARARTRRPRSAAFASRALQPRALAVLGTCALLIAIVALLVSAPGPRAPSTSSRGFASAASANSSSRPSATSRAPAPASPQAPLQAQLDAIARRIAFAARR